MILPLTIDLGYVESSRFHTFCFGYDGPLATTRPQARKNIPKIIWHLRETIEAFVASPLWPSRADSYPRSAFFDWLAMQDIDSFGMESFAFFEERGWHLRCPATKTPGYTVQNVGAFIDEEDIDDGYLEWRGTGRTYTTRGGDND